MFDGTKFKESIRTQVLVKARSLIEFVDNWCPGKLTNEKGQHCALGAIYEAHRLLGSSHDNTLPLLAEFATYRGEDTYNYSREVTDTSRDAAKIAGHNNMLGHAATIVMFDRAIAESRVRDNL